MTTQINRIVLPPHRRVKVAIFLDPHSAQTELKIEQGKLTHIQLLGLLLEHATALYKNMLSMQQGGIVDGNGNNVPSNDGGTNDAA